jgi:hypothetical protein
MEPEPVDGACPVEDYVIANAIGSAPSRLAAEVRNLPSLMFNVEPTGQDNAFKRYINETPTNAADGLLKGVLSVGNGLFQGISGVFVEPVRHAKRDGAVGFVRGVGKGLAGVVLKPVAGVIDLAGKTTQGIINTPITLYEAIKTNKEHDHQAEKIIASKKKGKIFGIPIEESFAYCEKTKITHVTIEAIRYLLDFVEEEGLFRISGNSNLVMELKEQFDKGENVILKTSGVNYGPAEVAGLLKLYLRALPEPLLTFVRYNNFLYIHQKEAPEKKLQAYKEEINNLPPTNKILLNQLMKLLHVVAANADKNLMRSSNLATVFGPALLHNQDSDFRLGKTPPHTVDPQQMFLEVSLSIAVISDLAKPHRTQ